MLVLANFTQCHSAVGQQALQMKRKRGLIFTDWAKQHSEPRNDFTWNQVLIADFKTEIIHTNNDYTIFPGDAFKPFLH